MTYNIELREKKKEKAQKEEKALKSVTTEFQGNRQLKGEFAIIPTLSICFIRLNYPGAVREMKIHRCLFTFYIKP